MSINWVLGFWMVWYVGYWVDGAHGGRFVLEPCLGGVKYCMRKSGVIMLKTQAVFLQVYGSDNCHVVSESPTT